MATILICDTCGATNWNLAAEGASHAQPANEVKGYEACDGTWKKGRWPNFRVIAGGGSSDSVESPERSDDGRQTDHE